EGRRVAVGGCGTRTGAVVILDRTDKGKVLAALPADQTRDGEVWSLAFSPGGDQVAFGNDDGIVCVWDLPGGERPEKVRELGRHARRGEDGRNPVRWLAFVGDRELLSVAEDGQVLRWNSTQEGGKEAFHFDKVENLFTAAMSPNRKWLAAG